MTDERTVEVYLCVQQVPPPPLDSPSCKKEHFQFSGQHYDEIIRGLEELEVEDEEEIIVEVVGLEKDPNSWRGAQKGTIRETRKFELSGHLYEDLIRFLEQLGKSPES